MYMESLALENDQYLTQTRRDGQMRVPVSRLGRSGNSNLVGSNPGRVKPMTLKLILGTQYY